MKSAYIALAAIGSTMALAGTAAPALAETVEVKYADLNLASAEGEQILQRRIDQAAKRACGLDQIRTGTRLKSDESKKCYREAKAQATKQIAALTDAKRLGG